MTGQSLLLDSAGQTCGNASNGKIHAEHRSRGDLDCVHTVMRKKVDDSIRWFALRVTYRRELKVQERLNKLEIRSFVPMMTVREEEGGKIFRRQVPAVGNLIFVQASRKDIEEYMLSEGDRRMTHFIWDKVTRQPIVIPEKQIEDFIRISTESSDDAIYLSKVSEKLRGGMKVKVRRGPFVGVTGTVVRLRKSRRILVELPGVLAVASAYVPIEDLEVLD